MRVLPVLFSHYVASKSCSVAIAIMSRFRIGMGKNVGLTCHERPLTVFEKKFLLCAERGDTVTVRK